MADPFVAAACRGFAALRPPARVLLAVSGGADSVALLDALWSGRKRRDLSTVALCVGHFDHRLRPDSAMDRELVARLAVERGLPFVSRVANDAPGGGGGLEERAREARYQALVEMAGELGCEAIVTAHTATDQAETLLWRLTRGAGARGLGAMRARRRIEGLWLLRPLLDLTREETRAYCTRRSLPFHDDPTNLNERPRARLRAEVLPILERLAPGAVRRLAAASTRLREDDDLLEGLAAEAAPGDIHTLSALPTALRRRALVQWAARETGSRRRLTAAHIEALEALVCSGIGEVDLPSTQAQRRCVRVVDGHLVMQLIEAGAAGLHRFGAPPV
jgi:tRNA(Ile)-lysidine synthase